MSENNELTGPEAAARVKELVEDIDFTMLTTADADGHLVSRPMSTREMDENGDIWFFTSDDTKKVDEVEADHDVSRGARVLIVMGGTDATGAAGTLAAVSAQHPDVLLLDVQMPAGTDADFARRRALATTDTELRLMASAATIGLSGIPERE